MLGNLIERAWGPARLLLLCFGGGVLANGVHVLSYPDSQALLAGAGGAVASLMGAIAVAFPHEPLDVSPSLVGLWGLMNRDLAVEVPAGLALLVWFALQTLFFAFDIQAAGVSLVATIAGFAVGAAAAVL